MLPSVQLLEACFLDIKNDVGINCLRLINSSSWHPEAINVKMPLNMMNLICRYQE